jgi:hypothetical protein
MQGVFKEVQRLAEVPLPSCDVGDKQHVETSRPRRHKHLLGIKLDISVETPLSDDDRDTLAGISVMLLAIANRQNLADQDVPPRPCSEQHPDRPGLYCVAAVGHDGDHLYDELGALDGLTPPPSRRMN